MSSMRPPHIHTCRVGREREDDISASHSPLPPKATVPSFHAFIKSISLDCLLKPPFTEQGGKHSSNNSSFK